MKSKTCNICGGREFGHGPNNRTSRNGFLPRCCTCQSLERHRAYRSIFLNFSKEHMKAASVLQFSRDCSVEPTWFRSYEVSEYDGHNSLDLQEINRPSDLYDLVICNHVLEHVRDDSAALRELTRIVTPRGFVFLTVPDPITLERGKDWGFPDPSQHGHYRVYGKDILSKFAKAIPDKFVLTIRACDPVTHVDDVIFLIFKSRTGAFNILKDWIGINFLFGF